MYSTSLSPTANTARRIFRHAAVVLAAAFALSSVAGCSLLSENVDRAAKGVGKVVTYYCENITVPEIREEVRAAVNKHSAPHSVAVTCADGGPTMESTAPAAPEATPATFLPAQPVAWRPIFIIERWLKPILDPASASAKDA